MNLAGPFLTGAFILFAVNGPAQWIPVLSTGIDDPFTYDGTGPKELIEIGRDLDLTMVEKRGGAQSLRYSCTITHLNDSIVEFVSHPSDEYRSFTRYFREVGGKYLRCKKNGRLKRQERFPEGSTKTDTTTNGDTLVVQRTWVGMNEYSSDTTFWLYKYIKGDLVLVRNYKGNSGFRIDNYWRYQYLDDRIIRTDSMYHASNEYYQVTRVTSIYEKNTAGQVSAMLEKIERIHPIQHGLETKSFFTYTDGFCTREDVQYNNGYSYYKPITLE